MNLKTQKTISILLGVTAAAGTVVTAVLVAKETPKAIEKIKELKAKTEKPKFLDYVKALTPVYWPACVVCAGTIASTTISQVMSVKAQASLIATSTLLSQGYQKYKGKIKDVFGFKVDKAISNDISKDEYELKKENLKVSSNEKLYYEEHIGFFRCNERDLLTAFTDLNQRLHTPDPSPEGTFYWTTLYFLIKDSKAKTFDKKKLEACKNIGWTTDYLCEVYEINCMWVHPYFTNVIKKETGEVLYTKIDFWEEPIFLEDSELSRYHYKSRADYEHEAELDMHDSAADDLYRHTYEPYFDEPNPLEDHNIKSMLNAKIDCDPVNDNGRRFQDSNLNSTTSNVYSDEDGSLPNESDIPESDFK